MSCASPHLRLHGPTSPRRAQCLPDSTWVCRREFSVWLPLGSGIQEGQPVTGRAAHATQLSRLRRCGRQTLVTGSRAGGGAKCSTAQQTDGSSPLNGARLRCAAGVWARPRATARSSTRRSRNSATAAPALMRSLKLSGAVQLLTKLGTRGVVQGSAPAAHYGGAVFTPETGANRRRPLRPAPGLVAALRQRLACKVGSSKGVIY